MNAAGKKLLVFPVLGLAGALVWTTIGGMSVAKGAEKPISIHRAHAGSFRHPYGKPIFILAMGSDQGAPKYGRGGKVTSGRPDSLHIIAINPVEKKATIVGIPRDSYVNLACGGGGKDKINAAIQAGGLKCIVDTVEALSGGRIRFDYYIIGGFQNLENMVNDIGGVPVDVEPGASQFGATHVLQDSHSRAKGIRTGKRTLSGHQALAYARDRHDYLPGDLARTIHQGQVIIGGLTKARALVATDPGKTLLFLRSILRNVTTTIPLSETLHLGLLMLQIQPGDVMNVRLPGHADTVGTASVVLLDNYLPILINVADDGLID
jgi:polyisoprenyl-teichoic acid--peptidoglycan teichoic acid transferase